MFVESTFLKYPCVYCNFVLYLHEFRNSAVLRTVCSAYQCRACRGEMGRSPWHHGEATAGLLGVSFACSDSCMMCHYSQRCYLLASCQNYFIIVLYYSEWNPLIAHIAGPSVDRCAAVYQQLAAEESSVFCVTYRMSSVLTHTHTTPTFQCTLHFSPKLVHP